MGKRLREGLSKRMNCFAGKSSWQPDYRVYRFKITELLLWLICGYLLGLLFFRFFYKTLFVFIAAVPFAYYFVEFVRKQSLRRRNERLTEQFREWIVQISGGLQAGYSLENACVKPVGELAYMFGGDADIVREIERMKKQLNNNTPIESILLSLGERSGIEEIESFSRIISIAKRSGGDLREIIGQSCEMISLRLDTQKEIRTGMNSGILEYRVMCVIPFGIFGYISLTTPGYFDVLYNNMAGIIVMTLCLLLYVLSVYFARKVMEVTV